MRRNDYLIVGAFVVGAVVVAFLTLWGIRAPVGPQNGLVHPMMKAPLQSAQFGNEVLAANRWFDPEAIDTFSVQKTATQPEIEFPQGTAIYSATPSPGNYASLVVYVAKSMDVPATANFCSPPVDSVVLAVWYPNASRSWLVDPNSLAAIADATPIRVSTSGLNGWVYTKNAVAKHLKAVLYVQDIGAAAATGAPPAPVPDPSPVPDPTLKKYLCVIKPSTVP
jgi:hypothetical protein